MVPLLYKAVCQDGEWLSRKMLPYQPLMLDPAAKVLHYGQEVFEGLKAYTGTGESPTLFRPKKNAKRINLSARRLSMPEIPEDIFMEGVCLTTALARPFIPDGPGQSLYIRPFMLGVDPSLLLDASRRYEFYVIASPSQAYHVGSMKLLVERNDCRASLGGTGHVKVGGNYAAALSSAERVKNARYDQTLWLDPEHRTFVEELSGMNVFAVIDNELHTPRLSGSILPGVVRDSVIELARHLGHVVHERRIEISELLDAMVTGRCTEFFACGTAAVITPVSKIHDPELGTINMSSSFPVAQIIRETLMEIQEGRAEDVFGWNYAVPLTLAELPTP